jgi:hypothetical protein
MSAVTIYTLFFDDLRMLAFPKSSDTVFYNLSFLAMLIFTAEFIISCFALDGYFLTFFFFLDLLSIITMVPDVGWLWVTIIGES